MELESDSDNNTRSQSRTRILGVGVGVGIFDPNPKVQFNYFSTCFACCTIKQFMGSSLTDY